MKKYCYVGYSNHKVVLWKGKFVSPHLDSDVLERDASEYTSICIGNKIDRELIPSQSISTKTNPFRILLNFFRCGPIYLKDIAFLCELYRPNELYASWVPLPKQLWIVWVIRNLVVGRHFAVLFREIAKNHSEARVIVSYSAAMLGVIYAFRRLGKPVYEIQHGYIGLSHPAYNRREIVGSNSCFCPSGYVVWNERTGQFLKSLGASNIEVVGFRHLTNFSTRIQREKINILYTTQWLTDLPEYIEDLIININDATWRLRIHPREDDERSDIKRLLIHPNVEICNPETPLADDLQQCDLHFTVHSSTVHEAAALNVISVFTSEIGKERFHYEIGAGMAVFVDAQTAVPTIRSLLNDARERRSRAEATGA